MKYIFLDSLFLMVIDFLLCDQARRSSVKNLQGFSQSGPYGANPWRVPVCEWIFYATYSLFFYLLGYGINKTIN